MSNERSVLNFRALSERLTGDADAIRGDRIPKKYEFLVEELEVSVKNVLDNRDRYMNLKKK